MKSKTVACVATDQSHTSGPWVVDVDRAKGRRGKKGPATMLMVVAEKGGMPGLIVNQPPLVTDTDWANARLIAAAPDMLAALESLFASNAPENVAKAWAAIRKAKGHE